MHAILALSTMKTSFLRYVISQTIADRDNNTVRLLDTSLTRTTLEAVCTD